MKFHSWLIILLIWFQLPFITSAQSSLRQRIVDALANTHGDIGVAIKHLERGDTVSYNGTGHFPMQSVYKFHLALAVMDQVDKGNLSLDRKILIRKEDFITNTWSPIAKQYPQGNVELQMQDILFATVAQSDNNGCDILFRLVGGPKKVNDYIKKLGVTDVSIQNTEGEMHQNSSLQFENWSTPLAAVQLLDLFYSRKILSGGSQAVLKDIMERTTTGPKRIKGLLPTGITVAHKTGMGAKNAEGSLSAINDIGVVTLPDGTHFAIAFFISNTKESSEKLEHFMAEISKTAYDHFAAGNK
jgi:beta-lactamase class A